MDRGCYKDRSKTVDQQEPKQPRLKAWQKFTTLWTSVDSWQAAGQSRADLDARDQLLIVPGAKVGSNIYSLRSRFTFKGNRTKSSAP